ncbi:MAG: hypothetical protein ACOYYF_16215 [Chloroflexota bacterium]|nr:hypothetical protein [Chloroflexota bacterium]MBI5703915.1 hypothetical protein [Chloroflexota bacterium]
MNSEQNQSNQNKNKFPFKFVTRIIAIIFGVVILLWCLSFGAQIALGIYLGVGMSNSAGTVLHSESNPDGTIIVHVVSTSCGATCDCSTRLDITYGQETKEGVYRVRDACDLEIKWLDQNRFEVIDKWGETIVLDAQDFQLRP